MGAPAEPSLLSTGRVVTRGLRIASGACLALWLAGLVLFVRRDGSIEVVVPRLRMPPAAEHNLAAWDLGPTIRASSYFGEAYTQHHPLFLVDGRASPSRHEKWASAQNDRHPWVEIRWREPRDLSKVVLDHAGMFEEATYTASHYRIVCLRANGTGPSVVEKSNRASRAEYLLACEGARGIRLEVEPSSPDAIVRLYEVEAWGR
jgi:hypothetical protein